MHIVIQKNNTFGQFFIENNEMHIADILKKIQEENISFLRISTFEEEKCLLDCYIPYKSEKQLMYRLRKSAKAQI